MVYISTPIGSRSRVLAVHAASGAVRWTQELDAAAISTEALIVRQGVLYLVLALRDQTSLLTTIEGDSGRIIWKREIADVLVGALLGSDSLVVASANNSQVVGVNVRTGETRWVETFRSPAGLAGSERHVVALSDVGQATRIDPGTGERVWTVDLGISQVEGWEQGPESLYIIGFAELSAGLAEMELVSLDVDAGEISWRTSAGFLGTDEFSDSDSVGVYLTAGSEPDGPSELRAYDPNGQVAWRSDPGLPLVVRDGIFVLGGSESSSSVTRLHLKDGSIRWRTSIPGILGSLPLVQGEGVVLAQTFGDHAALTALDPRTGDKVWSQSAGPQTMLIGSGEDLAFVLEEGASKFVN